jgi:hypothetical protein
VGIAKPRQPVTGIVGAAPDRVWDALLEGSPYLTPQMREMIAVSQGTLRFPAGAADSRFPGVNVESDKDQHTLAVSGQWWFRGVYRVSVQGPDALLCYQVFNAAPVATRWLVPLVAGSALRVSARPQFEQVLRAIGSLLGCPARLVVLSLPAPSRAGEISGKSGIPVLRGRKA